MGPTMDNHTAGRQTFSVVTLLRTGMGDRKPHDETDRIEVTLPLAQIERLERAYPGALKPSEAVRQAIEEAIRARERELTRDDVQEAIVGALEECPPGTPADD